MKKPMATWSIILFLGYLSASSVTTDWIHLKRELRIRPIDQVVQLIVNNWMERPSDFFARVSGKSWEKIIPLLSREKLEAIKPEEFSDNKIACRAFVAYLQNLSNVENLPKAFRTSFYEELSKNKDAKFSKLVKFIPPQWIEKDGQEVTKALVSPVESLPPLRNLSDSATIALFKNQNGACIPITIKALEAMTLSKLEFMRPECIAAIKDLDTMNLPQWLIQALPVDIFSKYNGALSKETLENLDGTSFALFGSLLDANVPICNLLDFGVEQHLILASISARCLSGYLEARKESGLGKNWEIIPITTLMQFTSEMQSSSWPKIHPTDFSFMPEETRRVILSNAKVCAAFSRSDLNAEIVKDFSEVCLHAFISMTTRPVALGSLWEAVRPEVVAVLTNEMLKAFESLSLFDFVNIPSKILQFLLGSEVLLNHLPKPVEQIIISPMIKDYVITAASFARIARIAPNVAVQLLEGAANIPTDVLADCDGEVIRKLKLEYYQNGQFLIHWNDLFTKLERKDGHTFSRVIESMSTRAASHFCSTITTLEEYLSFSWLRSNPNDLCRLALPFKVTAASGMKEAPELIGGEVSWKELLEVYELSDWTGASHNSNLLNRFAEDCDFWVGASEKHWVILRVIARSFLKNIHPKCVHKLNKIIRENCDIISFFSDDAFALHQAGELPCHLGCFREQQIDKISYYVISDMENPSTEELSRHALAQVTLAELKSVSHRQLKAIVSTQWAFVPKELKSEAVQSHYDSIVDMFNRLANTHRTKSEEEFVDESLEIIPDDINLKSLGEALELYLFIQQSGNLVEQHRISLVESMLIIRNLQLFPRLELIFEETPWSRALSVFFCQTSGELWNFLHSYMEDVDEREVLIKVPYQRQIGFDRDSILEISPEDFADPQLVIINDEFTDMGGPMRVLIGQFLGDITRDLLVPVSQGNLAQAQASCRGEGVFANAAKFDWGISWKVGLKVGLAMGKAIQLGIRLPFSLDEAFYSLLIDTSNEAIESYYEKTYSQDFANFEKYILALRGTNPVPDKGLLNILTRPECVRFTSLSSEAEVMKAKNDYRKKTNIRGCGPDEGFDNIEDLKSEEFFDNYFFIIRKMFLVEFKLFIRELVRGVEMTLPAVKEFSKIPAEILDPFAKFLPKLLNAKPITADDVVNSITFTGDAIIPCLVNRQFTRASNVVSAFIRSLDQKQLLHLIGVFTGASTSALEATQLNVVFLSPTRLVPAKFNFCEAASPEAAKDMPIVAPGKQYFELFEQFTQELAGIEFGFEPDCDDGGVSIFLGRWSTCAKSLTLYLSTAQSLFNSLAYLLNTPINVVLDR